MRWGPRSQPARRLALTMLGPCLVCTGTITAAAWPASAAAAAQPAGPQAEVISLTNARRADAGCGPVASQGELTQAAQAHAEDMGVNDYFDHTGRDGSAPWDRAAAHGFTGNGVGENIAKGYPSPAAVVDGWMNSDGHRENIENCSWTSIGIGYHAETATWVQMFGQGDDDPATPPPAPAPTPTEPPAAPPPEPDPTTPPDEPPAARPATPISREPTYTG